MCSVSTARARVLVLMQRECRTKTLGHGDNNMYDVRNGRNEMNNDRIGQHSKRQSHTAPTHAHNMHTD